MVEVICIYICFVKMSYFYLLAGYVLFHFLTPARAKNCILQSCIAPFNIFPKLQFSVMFPNQYHVRISFCLPFMPHALPIKSSLTWVPNIWQEVQIVQLLIIHFSSTSRYFRPLSCKYLHWCHILIHCYVLPCVYTGCPRRNVPDFGRVFLTLNYTDITQNTYIQSWTVTKIIAREIWNFDSSYTLTDYQIHIESGRNMWFL